MLFSCMRAELMKLKRSFIWVVFLILPLISTVMGVCKLPAECGYPGLPVVQSLDTDYPVLFQFFLWPPSLPFTAPTSGVWKISTTTAMP